MASLAVAGVFGTCVEHFAWCAGAGSLSVHRILTGDRYMQVPTTATICRDSVALLLVHQFVFTNFIVFIRYH